MSRKTSVERDPKTHRPLRLAVVGLGIGRMHLTHLRDVANVEVVGVCDADPRRLRKVQREFAIQGAHQDLPSMLASEAPDGLVVATPNHLHEEMVLAGLEAGCHVLCEKPLAHRWDAAERIASAAKGRKRITMLDLSFRFGAAARTVKRYLDSGAAGRMYHAHTVWARSRGIPFFGAWFHDRRRSGGGPIIDLAVHRLDLALWFLGEPTVVSVAAVVHGQLGRSLAARRGARFDVEDLGVALLRLRGGGSVLLECSWAENSGRTERMCTRVLGVDGGAEHENVGDSYEFRASLWKDRKGRLHPASSGRFAVSATTPSAEFVRSIRDPQHEVPNFATGLRLQRILEALYRSARERREIDLRDLRPLESSKG